MFLFLSLTKMTYAEQNVLGSLKHGVWFKFILWLATVVLSKLVNISLPEYFFEQSGEYFFAWNLMSKYHFS